METEFVTARATRKAEERQVGLVGASRVVARFVSAIAASGLIREPPPFLRTL